MKTKFNNQEVYHLWAHQTQSHAKGNGSVSFEGKRAYSYAACIGEIVKNEKGEKAYLVATRSYSVTTSGHQSMLRRSIPHGATIFYVYDLSRYGANNYRAMLEQMLSDIPDLALKAKRARVNKSYILSQIQRNIAQARKFAAFFSLPLPAYDGVDEESLQAQIDAAAKELEDTEKKRRQVEKEREEIRQERQKEALKEWMDGVHINSHYFTLPFQYLRIANDGETVETTLGATVPLDHVRRAAPIILRILDSKEDYTPNGKTIHLGHYTLSSIKDGIVTVGCHRFEESEIRRFAEVLKNLPEPSVEAETVEVA